MIQERPVPDAGSACTVTSPSAQLRTSAPGVARGLPGLLNYVLLDPAVGGAEHDRWLQLADRLLEVVAMTWQPDWGVCGPDYLRQAQDPPPRTPRVRAVTYLAKYRGTPLIDSTIGKIRGLPHGWLIDLRHPNQPLPAEDLALRAAATITSSGLMSPTPQEQRLHV
jgi:hypothetical protein